MGALFNSKCYSTNAEAVDALYSSALPAYTAGATSYLQEFVKVSGVWKIDRKSISSTGVVTNLTQSNAPVPVYPVCDESQPFADGVTVGWGIATIIVAAWAAAQIRKAAR
jgi:hypothetical protein